MFFYRLSNCVWNAEQLWPARKCGWPAKHTCPTFLGDCGPVQGTLPEQQELLCYRHDARDLPVWPASAAHWRNGRCSPSHRSHGHQLPRAPHMWYVTLHYITLHYITLHCVILYLYSVLFKKRSQWCFTDDFILAQLYAFWTSSVFVFI